MNSILLSPSGEDLFGRHHEDVQSYYQPMPAPSAALFQQPQQFAFGTGMPLPPTSTYCSKFPTRLHYMATILNLALRFGGNVVFFYQYHIYFASEAAAPLQQFNEDTYWGTLYIIYNQ